jgi:hypothetical protein
MAFEQLAIGLHFEVQFGKQQLVYWHGWFPFMIPCTRQAAPSRPAYGGGCAR